MNFLDCACVWRGEVLKASLEFSSSFLKFASEKVRSNLPCSLALQFIYLLRKIIYGKVEIKIKPLHKYVNIYIYTQK